MAIKSMQEQFMENEFNLIENKDLLLLSFGDII